MNEVMEDIITYMRFDGKHSFEDNIFSVGIPICAGEA
jgi:hypothetical protein